MKEEDRKIADARWCECVWRDREGEMKTYPYFRWLEGSSGGSSDLQHFLVYRVSMEEAPAEVVRRAAVLYHFQIHVIYLQ